jgi:hypothetical protein
MLHPKSKNHPIIVEGSFRSTNGSEKELPCGCSDDGVLKYCSFPHTTYSLSGEVFFIPEIWGYKCDNCGLVVLTPEVGDKLYGRIEELINLKNS